MDVAAGRVLVAAPMAREADAIRAWASRAGARHRVLVAGGGARARRAVAAALDHGGFDLVVAAGVCGGLDPSLEPGAVILGRRVVRTEGAEIVPDLALLDAARREMRARGEPFVSSSLLTVDAPSASRREKTELWNAHGAGGVDMETFGIAEAAAARGAPWLAVRVVLDPVSTMLPPSLLAWRDADDEREILRRALRRPSEWATYARLAWQLRKARAGLQRALPVVVEAAAREIAAPARSAACGRGVGERITLV